MPRCRVKEIARSMIASSCVATAVKPPPSSEASIRRT